MPWDKSWDRAGQHYQGFHLSFIPIGHLCPDIKYIEYIVTEYISDCTVIVNREFFNFILNKRQVTSLKRKLLEWMVIQKD